MGCAGSKLDEIEAVALCKARSDILSKAILLRYRLAEAHAGYITSLRVVGDSLEKFFDGRGQNSHAAPILTLPPQRKGDLMPPTSPIPVPRDLPAAHHHLSHSNSGSHVHFNPSDSEFSDEEEFHLHSVTSPPKTYLNYSKKAAAPGVSYEIAPPSPDVGYGYSYEANPYYAYPYSSSYGDAETSTNYNAAAAPSSPPQALTPPSPPKVPTWEFLNPFEAYSNNFYPSYSPSRSSKDVREEEGIPDLEEDEIEVIKETIDDHKHVSTDISSLKNEEVHEAVAEIKHQNHDIKEREAPMKEEVLVKKLVPQSRAASQAVKEIREEFIMACTSCNLISEPLEVGKRRYRRKKFRVSAPRIPLSSKNTVKTDKPTVEEEMVESTSLSSTLHKLSIWEKKLYEEVKAEEEMRCLHDSKIRLLKRLDERGAESDRIIATQAKIKKLATKIGVAIQVIDSISQKIGIIRDEELWPQVDELIQSFAKMWKALMECHKGQLEAVVESKDLDAAASGSEAAKELEFSVLRWIEQFRSWFETQRDFAVTLNSWLMSVIRADEPEMTADGPAPFSPGRLGAPPVFVICNQWAEAMKRTSGMAAVEAMRDFAYSVLEVWRRRRAESSAPTEKDDKAISRAIAELDRKLVTRENPGGLRIYMERDQERKPLEGVSLHEGLRHVFDAMERVAGASLRVYEDLLLCSQSERGRASAVD